MPTPIELSPCVLWEKGKTSAGYGVTYERGKQEYKHRVVYEQTYGPIPDGLYVLHRCDVRACHNSEHLFLGTHNENTADKVSKGRQIKGASSHLSKLNDEIVLGILADKRSNRTIAK